MLRDSRKIAAILAADVVGYSRLMGADEVRALAALQKRRAVFEDLVREFDGHEFGSVGDSLMAEFGSAVNAVECALALQERMANENAPLAEADRMQLRIGVNLGDVIEQDGSAFGDAVNVAARLQALAKTGGVLISGPVYDQVHLKIPARFVHTGSRQVKNIAEPVRIFEVLPASPEGIGGRIATLVASSTSRRVLRAAAVVAALVLAVALGLFWRELPVPGTGQRLGELLAPIDHGPSPNAIAVLPFVNMSGNPDDDYLGEGLAEELSNRLARIPNLRVAARTSAFAFKGKDLGVTEIADRLGVSYVVEGSVKREAGRIRVIAALVEGRTGASRWSNSYESPFGDFFTIEGDIGAQVLNALEIVLGTRAAETPSPSPPVQSSVTTYDFFLQGLAYLRQPRSARTLSAAEQLFSHALSEHPDFARAQAGLCQTLVERYALERVPALVAAAEEACARAKALDSASQEVHEAIGKLRLATGNAPEAETAYRHALALAPQSPDLLIGLASALEAGGNVEEAERAFQRSIAMQPRYAAAHLALGSFLFYQGRAAEAIQIYERATLLAPDNPTAFSNLGGAYLLLGDFERAADAFSRSLAIEPRRGSFSNLGTVHYYRGRYREATEMFEKAIEFAPADHRLWGNLATALLADARTDEAMDAYRRALELVDGELAINPTHAINRAQAAYYSSRLGDRDRARGLIGMALAEGETSNYVHYFVGLAELVLGDRTRALTHFRRAKQLGYPEALLRAEPELSEIRTII